MEFGATDLVEERGDEATEAVLELTAGIGADAALECVGTAQSIATAVRHRPARVDGRHRRRSPRRRALHRHLFPQRRLAWRARSGPDLHPGAPCRRALPDRSIPVGSSTTRPTSITSRDAYEAMDERRAIKSLIRVAS